MVTWAFNCDKMVKHFGLTRKLWSFRPYCKNLPLNCNWLWQIDVFHKIMFWLKNCSPPLFWSFFISFMTSYCCQARCSETLTCRSNKNHRTVLTKFVRPLQKFVSEHVSLQKPCWLFQIRLYLSRNWVILSSYSFISDSTNLPNTDTSFTSSFTREFPRSLSKLSVFFAPSSPEIPRQLPTTSTYFILDFSWNFSGNNGNVLVFIFTICSVTSSTAP